MSNKKHNIKKLRNYLLLTGPLALVSFLLMDVVGGINFPGYSWIKDPISALFANNSESLPICIAFAIVFFVLAFIGSILIYFISKTNKANKMLLAGLILFIISIIFGLIGHVYAHPVDANNDKDLISYSKDVTKEEKINNDSVDGSSTTSADISTSSDQSSAQTKTVIDEEATELNREKLQSMISDSQIVTYIIVESIFISLLLLSFILIFIGSFRKGGILYIGGVGLVCAIFVLYGLFACYYFALDIYGVSSRFINYTPAIFVSFVCGWAYITNPDNHFTIKL